MYLKCHDHVVLLAIYTRMYTHKDGTEGTFYCCVMYHSTLGMQKQLFSYGIIKGDILVQGQALLILEAFFRYKNSNNSVSN